MDEMRNEPLIAECAFAWGQVFRLYQNYLDVRGTCYPLADLTHVHPVYQHVLGISSVRLELRFGKKKVILRGIAAMKDAQVVVEYLTSQYLGRTGADKAWSRTREAEDQSETVLETQPVLEEFSAISLQDLSLKERAQAPTDKVETLTWQRSRQDQRERKRRRLHAERSVREHGFDIEKLAERLKEETLPQVAVPVRLLPGERAHYSTDATLCGEPVGGTIRYTYPAKDHGTLILTNKRLVYIGRKNQIVLDYARLFHISRLRGAIAFQAEHWYKREIFEVRRSLECTMYLECILERYNGSLYRVQSDGAELSNVWGGGRSLEKQAGFTSFAPGRYLDYSEPEDEAELTVDTGTMPPSTPGWDMTEVLDGMD